MSALLSPTKPFIQQMTRVPFRITVDQYQRMVQTGILGKYDRCELIEGVLVAKMSRNPPHDGILHLWHKLLTRILPAGWEARDQKALILDDSVPEPDIVVVRGDERSFLDRRPDATDAALVVEVAESSLDEDRKCARIFARNRVPEYWIVNLIDFVVEVYTQPSGPNASPTYASRQDFARGDSLALALDGTLIANLPVSDLLP